MYANESPNRIRYYLFVKCLYNGLYSRCENMVEFPYCLTTIIFKRFSNSPKFYMAQCPWLLLPYAYVEIDKLTYKGIVHAVWSLGCSDFTDTYETVCDKKKKCVWLTLTNRSRQTTRIRIYLILAGSLKDKIVFVVFYQQITLLYHIIILYYFIDKWDKKRSY